MNTVCFMRGLPGSGKTTLACSILNKRRNSGKITTIVSTDYFWADTDFSKDRLHEAHQWAQNCFRVCCETQSVIQMTKQMDPLLELVGDGLVIVDNTNVVYKEIKPYIELLKEYNLLNSTVIELIEPNTDWKDDVETLVEKTIHNVPLETIKRRAKIYQPNLTVAMDILNDFPHTIVQYVEGKNKFVWNRKLSESEFINEI